uniref:Elongator complex protein 2 n=1 Tax=Mesocestoides corti TaxID=53468 RepID=A0A5K3FRM8_MESCO
MECEGDIPLQLPDQCFMGRSMGRRAFVVSKHAPCHGRVHSDVVETANFSVLCEYTSAAINPRPNCMAVQRFHHAGRPQMLAYGSGRVVCLGLEVNNDMRVFKTLAAQADTVTCVAWIDSFKGPTFSRFRSLLISASSDGSIKIWDVDEGAQREVASFSVSTSVACVHGCYVDESETRVVVGAVSQNTVFGWSLTITYDTDGAVATMEEQPGGAFRVDQGSDSCLALRLVCLPGPMVLLFVGMTTGGLDVWIVKPDAWEPSHAATLRGHTDWLTCVDCVKMYPTEDDAASGVSGHHALVATGSQDNHIRVWHIQLFEGAQKLSGEKGAQLALPAPFSATHRLLARLESVIAGHDNWVTGLAWSPVSWTPSSRPQLLSSSRDKSLIIWAPSRPLFSQSPGPRGDDDLDMWLEQARFGTVGGNLLGYHGCAWGNYNNEVFGHGFWGDLSIWSTESEPRITLTGHFGAVTSLSWCRDVVDGVPLKTPEASHSLDYPTYLLTASRDFTVRLHGLFYTEGSGCNPPVQMWRELARPQVHGYEMNDVVSLDAVRYVSAGDEKVGRVFSATRGFVESTLSDATIVAHPSLQSLAAGAVQPALGLSNQADAGGADDDGGRGDRLGNPLYPPTEAALSEATLWTETNKLYGHGYEVYCLAAHPKGSLVASACKASKEEFAKVFLWRTDTWQVHQHLPFHQLTVTQMRFDSTGDRLVSVSRDRTWALWKAEPSADGQTPPTLKLHKRSPPGKDGHSRIIWACAWLPDNSAFVTASRDKHIMVWDGDSGARLGPPHSLSEAITAFDVASSIFGQKFSFAVAGFESGGIELLAISLADKACRSLWKLPSDWSHMGVCVRRLALHPLDDEWVALASGGDDGVVRVFRISPASLMELEGGGGGERGSDSANA